MHVSFVGNNSVLNLVEDSPSSKGNFNASIAATVINIFFDEIVLCRTCLGESQISMPRLNYQEPKPICTGCYPYFVSKKPICDCSDKNV